MVNESSNSGKVFSMSYVSAKARLL